MFRIDQCAYTSKLQKVHPAEKFAFSVGTMLICLCFNVPEASLAVIIIMACSSIVLAGVKWELYLKLMCIPLGFLLAGVTAAVISVTKQPVDFILSVNTGAFYMGVRQNDLIMGASLFLRALGAVSCLYFLALTTPMPDIIMFLKRLKLPSLFVELMELVYRFIFVLLETAGKIHLSQTSRWGYFSLRASYRSLGLLLFNLFTRAFWRSRMSFTSLLSRCYTGSINVLTPSYGYSVKNIFLIIVVEGFLLLLGLKGRGII